MADEKQVEAAGEEAATPKKAGLMTIVKAVAFVSIMVALQVAAAAVLIPTADETRKLGEKLARAHEDHGADEHGETAEHDGHSSDHGGHSDTHEVELGSYHIVSFNPKTGTSLSVDFELYGIVLAADEAEFSHLYSAHQKRISEQVTIAVRGLEAADLLDPGLGLIKRLILEKTNRALGKPLVREAVISQFAFMER